MSQNDQTLSQPADEGESASRRFPTVGIGTSAGGVRALQMFFESLPDKVDAAFVVIVHLDPEHQSELPSILATRTKMAVTQVAGREQLLPGHVYVIPPNRQLRVEDQNLDIAEFDEPRWRRAPIDLFFRSLAARRGDDFAIVLSGAGSDGALGIKAVKEAGGIILVQDPDEAEFNSMPRSAIATGLADFALPVREIATRLPELIRNRSPAHADAPSEADEGALQRILSQLRTRTGHDFSNYKKSTVRRRILRRMQVQRAATMSDYLAVLRDNAGEAQALFADLLISVTMFFRDAGAFDRLRALVVPKLFEDKGAADPVRVWVPGCATGEEAYSIAMILLEEAARREIRPEIQIFASDLDDAALAFGREARYPLAIETDVSEERLRRFFAREGDQYRVTRELRDVVLFARHSLLKDPPFSHTDLISCRNLLIYLDRQRQQQVCAAFHFALNPIGLLVHWIVRERRQPARPVSRPRPRFAHLRAHARGERRQAGAPARTVVSGTGGAAVPGAAAVPGRGRTGRASRGAGAAGAAERRGRRVLPCGPSLGNGRALHPAFGRAAGQRHHRAGAGGAAIRPARVAPPGAFPQRDEPQRSDRRPFRRRGDAQGLSASAAPIRRRLDAAARRSSSSSRAKRSANWRPARPIAERAPNEEVRQLRQELQVAQSQLRASRDEYEGANEDLRAANEELQSINEEYRSTAEELETSKEELQSINEELQTVNAELKTKLESVSQAHSDIQNLMAATDVGILFLDPQLRIKRFTPPIADLFNVAPGDEGRSITDFTHTLDFDGLAEDARSVHSHARSDRARGAEPQERLASDADEALPHGRRPDRRRRRHLRRHRRAAARRRRAARQRSAHPRGDRRRRRRDRHHRRAGDHPDAQRGDHQDVRLFRGGTRRARRQRARARAASRLCRALPADERVENARRGPRTRSSAQGRVEYSSRTRRFPRPGTAPNGCS